MNPTDPTSLVTLLPLFGQLGALVVVVWLFIKAQERQADKFDAQLKAQRDECNVDRSADRADRAQERQDFLASMGQMRASIDALTQKVQRP